MKKTLIVIGLATLFSSAAFAGRNVTLSENKSVSSNSNIHIDVPVGEIELLTHDKDEIEVKIVVKPQNDNWFNGEDIDDAELKYRVDGKDIYLKVDKEKSVQEWTIKIPTSANLDLDVGVGEVDLEDLSKNVHVDVGVGEVKLELASDDYRRIELDAGVGEVDLDGFKGARTREGIVSGSLEWRGEGEHEIEIDVGVGEVDVKR